MSKAEILASLPQLTRDERREVVLKVHQLDGDDWLDEGAFSNEEKALIETRVAEHERSPESAIPWSEFEARLSQRLGE